MYALPSAQQTSSSGIHTHTYIHVYMHTIPSPHQTSSSGIHTYMHTYIYTCTQFLALIKHPLPAWREICIKVVAGMGAFSQYKVIHTCMHIYTHTHGHVNAYIEEVAGMGAFS